MSAGCESFTPDPRASMDIAGGRHVYGWCRCGRWVTTHPNPDENLRRVTLPRGKFL